MMKWIIPVAGAAVIGWFVWFQVNATKISYVNGLPPYDVMPGREFILQRDCYVFNWRRDPAKGFPLLGAHAPGTRSHVADLPSDSSPTRRGQELPALRILDLIPKGTRLLLTSVRREESRRTGILITYEAKFLDEVDRPYQKVDLRPFLLPAAPGSDVPGLDPEILVPWIKR
jgi:hypothetical protein